MRQPLYVNPYYRLVTEKDRSGRPRVLEVTVPVPKRGPVATRLTGRDLTSALRFFGEVHLARPVRPAEIPADLRKRLAEGGVLLPKSALPKLPVFGSKPARLPTPEPAVLKRSALEFRKKGFTVVPGLLSDAIALRLEVYYDQRIRNGFVQRGDARVRTRWAEDNETISLHFLKKYAPLISRIAGRKFRPSYTYVSVYGPKSSLPSHLDREECEITISLALSEGSESWPLYLGRGSRAKRVDLSLGDAVIFRGRKIPHFRKPSPGSRKYSCLLLHYVPAA